ncbi:tyrosine-type recombinase/integrase [Klebsiella pneumoniae]|uniref:tyrosine-type recombinase/integrase n=1 Tax=Klebsiella TaxID=570 RepID=UPI0018DB4947|nr:MULTISPECIES: tyrosine-type recombinase/integrase [Klebsiella]MBH8313587.1 tyrosine-type recombinase/integrase [Klebsiella pneumoniae]MBH8358723.1 tyrosine-type recombinase/integrase [Klebsiella pneumoniae]MCW9232877.1 tyrosine-type recombinase/integrase [Klebsiella pneumoniae]MCW9286469.1 tyrosine-type recombinase/integrase [Klebsiella pneumoniae]MCW9385920.1 tyrosine-type recombinase/integrase [Klebsiella pneumoniae]
MELIWATEDLVIAGRPYTGFPILLWDTMESCVPVNDFLRHYLLRGAIGSTKSWPSTGRAMYDFFSFLQANDIDWRNVDRREAKSIIAAYRDYCLVECELARSTTRQRLHYICKFYEYAQTQGWVNCLPFSYEERTVKREIGFLAHVDASGGKTMANDLMPRAHKVLPKYLSMDEIRAILQAAENPHHRIMILLGLQTGLRREEIATLPLAYIFDPDKNGRREHNIRIRLDPFDGHGMLTKGSKARDIYVSHRFLSKLYRYVVQVRGERSSLSPTKYEPLFLNQFGEPFANDGKGIERIVRNIGKKVGIKVHPHMLRHTYATHTLVALQRNRGDIDPLVFVQRQLGHSSLQTTMVYLHLINELADSAVLAYDDELNDSLEMA